MHPQMNKLYFLLGCLTVTLIDLKQSLNREGRFYICSVYTDMTSYTHCQTSRFLYLSLSRTPLSSSKSVDVTAYHGVLISNIDKLLTC